MFLLLMLQRTCKSAVNHRPAFLPGWQRVFSLVSASQIRNGNADRGLNQLAAVALAPWFRDNNNDNSDDHGDEDQHRSPARVTFGALFEISEDDFAALCGREHRYEMRELDCFELPRASCSDEGGRLDNTDSNSNSNSNSDRSSDRSGQRPEQQAVKAFVVIESTDAVYHAKCAAEDAEEGRPEGSRFHELIGRFYRGPLWGRRDILPVTKYLRFCVAAARVIGGQRAVDNFLDTSFLADRTTSIRTVSECRRRVPAGDVRPCQGGGLFASS